MIQRSGQYHSQINIVHIKDFHIEATSKSIIKILFASMILVVLGYWYIIHIPRAIIDELHDHEYSVLSEQLHGSNFDKTRKWVRCELLVNNIKEINFTAFVSEKKTLVYHIAFDDDSYANMFVVYEANHWKVSQLFFSTYHDKECLQTLRLGVPPPKFGNRM